MAKLFKINFILHLRNSHSEFKELVQVSSPGPKPMSSDVVPSVVHCWEF